jgi:hypothetical protein
MKNWDHLTGEVEMTDLNLPLDSELLEQEELLGSEQSSFKLSDSKSKGLDLMRAAKLASGICCLFTIFQAQMGLVSAICYAILGVVSIQGSLSKNAGRYTSTQESSVFTAALASYMIIREIISLYCSNGFQLWGMIAASVILCVTNASWKNKDLFSSKFTSVNIAVGFVSLAAAITMLSTTIDTPILGDLTFSSGQMNMLKIGMIATFFIYGLMLNDKFGMVKKGPLAIMVILSVVVAVITLGVLIKVAPQVERLSDDEHIFNIMSVTHKDQVEEVCGDSKYALEGKYLAKIWEGSNSEAYLNDSCMSSFASSVRSQGSLFINSLIFSIAFLVLAVITSVERLLKKRVFKPTSDQKNILAGVLIVSLVILVAFNVSLMHGDNYSQSYSLYKTT